MLQNGLHASHGVHSDPGFVSIGNPDLIDKRSRRTVPLQPNGTLADYVPFYFTPKSPMLLNIKTGYSGVMRRPNDEIAILVSSCKRMSSLGVTMLFTDRHAYTSTAAWTAQAADLANLLDWDILRRHDFSRTDSYPDKMDRYQAEALAHKYVPGGALLGIGCSCEATKQRIESDAAKSNVDVKVLLRPSWYF